MSQWSEQIAKHKWSKYIHIYKYMGSTNITKDIKIMNILGNKNITTIMELTNF